MSAETPALAATPHLLGTHGLWGQKDMKLPNYVEQVAAGIMKTGATKSKAIQIALGKIEDWKDGKGSVSPEVRAASAQAWAEWLKSRAEIHARTAAKTSNHTSDAEALELSAFNSAAHPRAGAGSAAGGQFVPLGTARNQQAAQAQKSAGTQGTKDYKDVQSGKAKLGAMKDGELEKLARLVYSSKTSNATVVKARLAVEKELANRGIDVKKFGALGGGESAAQLKKNAQAYAKRFAARYGKPKTKAVETVKATTKATTAAKAPAKTTASTTKLSSDDPTGRVLELAAVNKHHVPGTAYHWTHGYHPLDVATALLWKKTNAAKKLHASGAQHFNAEPEQWWKNNPHLKQTLHVGQIGNGEDEPTLVKAVPHAAALAQITHEPHFVVPDGGGNVHISAKKPSGPSVMVEPGGFAGVQGGSSKELIAAVGSPSGNGLTAEHHKLMDVDVFSLNKEQLDEHQKKVNLALRDLEGQSGHELMEASTALLPTAKMLLASKPSAAKVEKPKPSVDKVHTPATASGKTWADYQKAIAAHAAATKAKTAAIPKMDLGESESGKKIAGLFDGLAQHGANSASASGEPWKHNSAIINGHHVQAHEMGYPGTPEHEKFVMLDKSSEKLTPSDAAAKVSVPGKFGKPKGAVKTASARQGVGTTDNPKPDYKAIKDVDVGEPALPKLKPGQHLATGVLVKEPDGRIWVLEPKGHFGGYEHTFPKGTVENDGLTPQQSAHRELFEEIGLKAKITGFLGDYQGDTSVTRMYVAERTGGVPHPDDSTPYVPGGQEAASVKLVSPEQAEKLLNKKRDKDILEDFKSGAGQAPDAHAPEPAAATKLPADPFTPVDTSSWKKVGAQAGSNLGGTYEAPDGSKFYVKSSKSPDHARNEALASALYKLTGTDAADVHLAKVNGQLGTASPLIDGATPDLATKRKDPAYLAKVQSGFAADAWLANWDTAGLGFDNMVTDKAGNPVRVDPGGTLLYRAQGAPKGSAFGTEAGEWNTLRNPSMNPQSTALFGGMTQEQLTASAQRVVDVKPSAINKAVDDAGFDPTTANLLKVNLQARRKYIAKRAGIALPEEKAVKPTTGSPEKKEYSSLSAASSAAVAKATQTGSSVVVLHKTSPTGEPTGRYEIHRGIPGTGALIASGPHFPQAENSGFNPPPIGDFQASKAKLTAALAKKAERTKANPPADFDNVDVAKGFASSMAKANSKNYGVFKNPNGGYDVAAKAPTPKHSLVKLARPDGTFGGKGEGVAAPETKDLSGSIGSLPKSVGNLSQLVASAAHHANKTGEAHHLVNDDEGKRGSVHVIPASKFKGGGGTVIEPGQFTEAAVRKNLAGKPVVGEKAPAFEPNLPKYLKSSAGSETPEMGANTHQLLDTFGTVSSPAVKNAMAKADANGGTVKYDSPHNLAYGLQQAKATGKTQFFANGAFVTKRPGKATAYTELRPDGTAYQHPAGASALYDMTTPAHKKVAEHTGGSVIPTKSIQTLNAAGAPTKPKSSSRNGYDIPFNTANGAVSHASKAAALTGKAHYVSPKDTEGKFHVYDGQGAKDAGYPNPKESLYTELPTGTAAVHDLNEPDPFGNSEIKHLEGQHPGLKSVEGAPFNTKATKKGKTVIQAQPGMFEVGDKVLAKHHETGEVGVHEVTSIGKEFPSGGAEAKYHYLAPVETPKAAPKTPPIKKAEPDKKLPAEPAVPSSPEHRVDEGLGNGATVAKAQKLATANKKSYYVKKTTKPKVDGHNTYHIYDHPVAGGEEVEPGYEPPTGNFSGDQITAHYKANVDLSSAENKAVTDYSNSDYAELNQQLRAGKVNQSNKVFAANLTKAMEHYSTPDSVVVTRKMQITESGLPPIGDLAGHIYTDPAFASTSFNPNVWHGNVVWTIHVPKGSHGIAVNAAHTKGGIPHPSHINEQEFILPAGSHFAVTSDKKSGGLRRIEAVLVSDEFAKDHPAEQVVAGSSSPSIKSKVFKDVAKRHASGAYTTEGLAFLKSHGLAAWREQYGLSPGSTPKKQILVLASRTGGTVLVLANDGKTRNKAETSTEGATIWKPTGNPAYTAEALAVLKNEGVAAWRAFAMQKGASSGSAN